MGKTAKGPSRLDWFSMSCAGACLGLTLALACSMVFGSLPLGIPPQIHAQLTMWIVPPIWFCTLSASFAFRTGPAAWRALALANLLAIVPALTTLFF